MAHVVHGGHESHRDDFNCDDWTVCPMRQTLDCQHHRLQGTVRTRWHLKPSLLPQSRGSSERTFSDEWKIRRFFIKWDFWVLVWKTLRNQDRSPVTSVPSKHGSNFGLSFSAHPSCSEWEWVQLRFFITTGYCYVFICLYGKTCFCHLQLGQHMQFALVSVHVAHGTHQSDALNKVVYCMRL